MKTDTNNVEKEFARSIELLAARSKKIELEEALTKFDEIESIFLPRVSSKPQISLEIRRRIAEWKLIIFSQRGNSPEKAVQLFNNNLKIGFTNFEREAALKIYFAKFFFRIKDSKRATSILEELCIDLDKLSASENLEVYQELKSNAKTLLQKLGENHHDS
jgi:tetratricopeptide (TPR) repeat protein